MRVLYWPRDEYDCTPESRAIEHPSTLHMHCKTDAEVIASFLLGAVTAHCGVPPVDMWTSGECTQPGRCAWHDNRRYRCLCGPGGLVRAVLP